MNSWMKVTLNWSTLMSVHVNAPLGLNDSLSAVFFFFFQRAGLSPTGSQFVLADNPRGRPAPFGPASSLCAFSCPSCRTSGSLTVCSMFKGRETACCVEAPGGASIDKSVIISACYQWKQVQPLFKIWKVMKGNEAINTVTELIHRAGKRVSFHHESQHFYRGILDRLPTDSFNLSKYKEKAAQDCQLGCDKTGSGLHPRGSGAEERLVWAVEVLSKAPSAHPHLHRRTWLIHTSSQRPPWVELVAWQQNCLALTDLSPLMHFILFVYSGVYYLVLQRFEWDRKLLLRVSVHFVAVHVSVED